MTTLTTYHACSLMAQAQPPLELTSAGLAIMACSIAAVLSLTGFCMYRVLTLPAPQTDELKGPLMIDTRDTQDAD